MNTSQNTSSLVKALVLAQKKIKHATKDAKNPHFKNDYATLESVIDASKDHLLDNEIVVVQAINDKSLVTRLVHSSGEFMESSFELLVDKQNMQGLGSAVTYARRYSLAAMLNISQADDDGNEASSKPLNKQTPKTNSLGIQTANEFMSSNPNEYIINLGDKNRMTGTKLSDHKPEWIKKSIESTLKWHEDNNKALHKNTQEFVEKASAYLKSLPNFNSDESIPF